jgi:hypothetical protein
MPGSSAANAYLSKTKNNDIVDPHRGWGATAMIEGSDAARLNRVETEVATIRSEMGDLKTEVSSVKADIRGLGGILSRIEESVKDAQSEQSQRDQRSRPNLVAVVSILITIITILVGGAWTISGTLGHLDERSVWQMRSIDQLQRR